MKDSLQNLSRAALMGMAVGDALGVPVEFTLRSEREMKPVTTMQGNGTWNQPTGTWSDDSSLAFCLADSLTGGYDLTDIGRKLALWRSKNLWTAHGEVFDIGNQTSFALNRIENLLAQKQPVTPISYKESSENSNGNGSLMRILPLLFYIHDKPIDERFSITRDVSGLTHGHIRAVVSCFIYMEYARLLILGVDKLAAYEQVCDETSEYVSRLPEMTTYQMGHFKRIFDGEIQHFEKKKIQSKGYVVYALEVALWTMLREEDYKTTVLAAVNLGEDTDTNAAIAGGLAGIYYGYDAIPKEWIEKIARKDDILLLSQKLVAV